MEYHCPVDVVAISESPLVKSTLSRRCRQNVLQQHFHNTHLKSKHILLHAQK